MITDESDQYPIVCPPDVHKLDYGTGKRSGKNNVTMPLYAQITGLALDSHNYFSRECACPKMAASKLSQQ